MLYTACAKSQAAHQRIRQLTDYWNNEMADGKWKHTMCWNPRELPVFYAPRLPELLTDDEVARYSFERRPKAAPLGKSDDHSYVARNASQYDRADSGVEIVEMLGHSQQAVSLPKGKSLSYDFTTELSDSCLLRTAMIPTHPMDKNGDVRYAVSIDGASEEIISFLPINNYL